jgi:hypothetical protein
MPGPGDLDPCLVQKHTRAHIYLTEFRLMAATLGLDRFTVTLGCMISLFFRVSLSRTRVRCILERLGVT